MRFEAQTARAPEHNLATPFIRFGGQVFEPLASGALFWPAEDTLLVADLHLEKLASYARTGQLLPPYDTGLTLTALEADLNRTGASRLISLGDNFHRDHGHQGLQPRDRARLEALMAKVEWTWLAGNHDPKPHALGGYCQPRLASPGLEFAHEPKRGAIPQISGHLHPAARVAINGRSLRRPCFAYDSKLMIMPAYGAATGSLNILSPAFAGLFSPTDLQVVVLGQGRVYAVSSKRLARG